MSIWDHLFDNDYRQRSDITDLQDQLTASASSAAASNASTQREVGNVRQEIARLDLTIEALVRILEARGQLTRQELRDMIVAIDLEDGKEDGRMGPDRTRKAPKCTSCGRPVNPKREACVFCNTPLPAATPRRRPYR